jgi:geranylgeranyl diphosphate synthase, type I
VTTSLVPAPSGGTSSGGTSSGGTSSGGTSSGGTSPRGAPAALARAAALVAPALADAVTRLDATLQPPVLHHLKGGGKYVRAGLVLLSAAAAGGTPEDGLAGAVAIELVHNYSLLHDDVIDGDRERRHRPTVWAQFGVGTAIVAGDSLAALASQVLLDDPTPAHVRAARCLADATQAMIAGQSADMAFESRSSVTLDECLDMERGKTGALLSAAAAIGATLGGGRDDVVATMADYGDHLGVAFQAVDDLLGIWGEPAATGKPVGADLVARKKTLPVAAAMAAGGEASAELRTILEGSPGEEQVARATELIESTGARDQVAAIADRHLHEALAALDRVDLAAGPRDELVAVARYVTARDR